MSKAGSYEVYIGRIDGVIKYIGSGRKGRHKHLTSGVSNVYEANKAHFSGGKIVVSVSYFNTKEESLNREIELIRMHQPEWNVLFTKIPSKYFALKQDINYWKKMALRSTKWKCRLAMLVLEKVTANGLSMVHSSEIGQFAANLYLYRVGKSSKVIGEKIPFIKSVVLENNAYIFTIDLDVISDREQCDNWKIYR